MAQFVLWALFIPSWLFIIPLNKKRVKRFLSVTFFITVLGSIFWQMAEIYGWWIVKENLFFLSNISSFIYGFTPVATIYLFYFTYPNPWLFFGANLVLDAIQALVVSPLVFQKLGFYEMGTLSNFGLFLLLFSQVPIIYFYQRWYDRDTKSDKVNNS